MIEDSVLIDKIRENDDRAFEQLSEKYSGLVQKLVSRSAHGMLTHEDREDLTQEAQVLLYKAARTYDGDSGLTFGLYAGICIRNGLISLARKRKKETECVDGDYDFSDIAVPDTTETVSEEESALALMEKIRGRLSERELAVFKYMTLDYKNSRIAKELGISPKAVENAVFRIKKKLRALLL